MRKDVAYSHCDQEARSKKEPAAKDAETLRIRRHGDKFRSRHAHSTQTSSSARDLDFSVSSCYIVVLTIYMYAYSSQTEI